MLKALWNDQDTLAGKVMLVLTAPIWLVLVIIIPVGGFLDDVFDSIYKYKRNKR